MKKVSSGYTHSGRSLCKRGNAQPAIINRRAGPFCYTRARRKLKPFSNMSGAHSVHNSRQKCISEVVDLQFKIELGWNIYREYLELGLATNLKRRDLCQYFSQLSLKLFFRFGIEGLKVKDLAQILEVTSQRDWRDHSPILQVDVGEDLLKNSAGHYECSQR